jgi:hypothetical protein
VQDFSENFLSKLGAKRMSVMWIMFEAICWTLWLNRNVFLFNNLLISFLHATIFILISFLQHWMVAVREEDRSALERVTKTIRA